VGAYLVLSSCKYIYHRDELQPHAQFCWILPSKLFCLHYIKFNSVCVCLYLSISFLSCNCAFIRPWVIILKFVSGPNFYAK
jgi:hypothetical protein